MGEKLPVVSIVTPSYNLAEFIEETILSVKNQDYPYIEHIVVDGGSNDDTLDILRKYDDTLRWISEPDEGQTEAINKGWQMAGGEILAFLNADDTYLPAAVSAVVEFFQKHPEADLVYGECYCVDGNGCYLYSKGTKDYSFKGLLVNYIIPQQSTFFRKRVLAEVGMLDPSLRLLMDHEFELRVARKHNIQRIPKALATYRIHGEAKMATLQHEIWPEMIRVLDKFFADPDLPAYMKELKPHAYSSLHLWWALGCYSQCETVEARKHLFQALRLYPGIFFVQPRLMLRIFIGSLLSPGMLRRVRKTLQTLRQYPWFPVPSPTRWE